MEYPVPVLISLKKGQEETHHNGFHRNISFLRGRPEISPSKWYSWNGPTGLILIICFEKAVLIEKNNYARNLHMDDIG